MLSASTLVRQSLPQVRSSVWGKLLLALVLGAPALDALVIWTGMPLDEAKSIALWALVAVIASGAALSRKACNRTMLYPASVVLAATFLATLFSIRPLMSIFGPDGLITTLSIAVLGVASATMVRRADIRTLALIVVSAAVAMVIYARLQRVGIDFVEWGGYQGRAFGSLGAVGALAMWIAMALPLTLYLWPARKRLLLVVLAIEVAGLLVTQERAAFIGPVLALIVFVPVKLWYRLAAIIAMLILFRVLLVVRPATLTTRLAIWKTVLIETANRPLVGSGPGGLAAALWDRELVIPGEGDNRHAYIDRAHNAELDIFADTGGAGLYAYGFLASAVLWSAVAAYRNLETRRMAVALGASLASGLIAAQFSPTTVPVRALMWVLAGCIVALPTIRTTIALQEDNHGL